MKSAQSLPLLRRIASLAIALFSAPALAVAGTTPDAAGWLKQNTDLSRAQVVIADADVVYGFEALTPRLATDEVIGLVRTEAISPAWAASHHFRSWDAHVLVDCSGGRMRFIRSATYPESNRQGAPTLRLESDEWISPTPDAPAAKLVAAACDPGFHWPLRTAVAEAAPAPLAPAAPALVPAPAPMTATVTASTIPHAPPAANRPAIAPVPASHTYAVQVAYGPQRVGADRALAKAQRLLGTTPDALVASTLRSYAGEARRYTAVLDGFSSADAAAQACAALAKAGQPCFTRRSPSLLQARQAVRPPAARVERATSNLARRPQKSLRTAAAGRGSPSRFALAALVPPQRVDSRHGPRRTRGA